MSTRYVCARGCGGHAYTPGIYKCPTCGLKIRFLDMESAHPSGCQCYRCGRSEVLR